MGFISGFIKGMVSVCPESYTNLRARHMRMPRIMKKRRRPIRDSRSGAKTVAPNSEEETIAYLMDNIILPELGLVKVWVCFLVGLM